MPAAVSAPARAGRAISGAHRGGEIEEGSQEELVWSHVGGGRELHALCRRIAVGNLTHHRGQSPAELGCFGSAARGASAPGTNHQWELAPTDYSRLPRRASRVRFQRVARWRERGGSAEIRVSARFLTMSGRAEGLQRGSRGSGPGGSLPRADSQGMSHGLGGRDPTRPPLPSSRPATGIGFIGGGAILKNKSTVAGTSTAAAIWSTGAVGIAVGLGRIEIAVALSIMTFFTLRLVGEVKKEVT